MHTSIVLVFYKCFCMCVDFYLLSFKHFNSGPMTLPTHDMWQCHAYVWSVYEGGPRGNTPYQIYTFNFNLLGVTFIHQCARRCTWGSQSALHLGVHFLFGKGW